MASLTGSSIASSYEQLLALPDGGLNGTTLVAITDGDSSTEVGFKISTNALSMNSTNQLQFGDTGTYIHQSADGVLDLVSDTEIEINATTIDMNGALDLSGNALIGGNVGIGCNHPSVPLEVELSGDTGTYFEGGGSGNDASDLRHLTMTASTTSSAGDTHTLNAESGSGVLKFATSGSDRMIVNSTGVGIGVNPDTTMHIHKATAGTVDSNANAQLTIENNSHAGIQFLSPLSANNIIYFGNHTDNDVAYIGYIHSSNDLQFFINGGVRLQLDTNSRISLGNNDASGVATNTVFGNLAGNFSGGSANCTAIGLRALDALTGGSQNLGVGEDALGASVDGVSNTAVGVYAMSSGAAANYNTGIGGQALSFVTGSNNTGIGFQAATTGSNNITSGSDNTLIGAFTAASSVSATNQIVIGKSATGTGDNEIALGNTSITAIKAQVSSITAYSSDERTKKDIKDYNLKGLDFIKDLQLKTYIYKNPADFPDEIRSSKWDQEGVEKQADPTETQVGLIAQDVEEALKKHGIGNVETYAPTQESGIKTLTYGNLIFPLIKAVQELSAKVTELENK